MNFLHYILEAGCCVGILWVAYYLLLRNETCFIFNRFYLLFAILLSIVVPLLKIPLWPAQSVQTPSIVDGSVGIGGIVAFTAEPHTPFISILLIVLAIYFFGAAFLLVRFVQRMLKIRRVFMPAQFSDTKNYAAFTFFRKIVINRNALAGDDYEKIVLHEQTHARQLHSIDLLAAELFLAFQWFNPFAWQLKKSLAEVHEYLADAQVIAHGVEVDKYKQLLYSQATGIYPEYGSGFSYSLTKKRLLMMTKTKHSKLFALKMAAIAAAILLSAGLFGCGEQPNDATETEGTLYTEAKDGLYGMLSGMLADMGGPYEVIFRLKSNEIITYVITNASEQNKMIKDLERQGIKNENVHAIDFYPDMGQKSNIATVNSKEYMAFNNIEVKPKFQGGDEKSFLKYVSANIIYPQEARSKKVAGRIFVEFVIDKNGMVGNVKIVKGLERSLEKEVVRVVSASPKWEPGLIGGKPMGVKYRLPIVFQLATDAK